MLEIIKQTGIETLYGAEVITTNEVLRKTKEIANKEKSEKAKSIKTIPKSKNLNIGNSDTADNEEPDYIDTDYDMDPERDIETDLEEQSSFDNDVLDIGKGLL